MVVQEPIAAGEGLRKKRLIDGLCKFIGLELRRFPRYETAVNVEFYACDGNTNAPLTPKARGRLVEISRKGARLRTDAVRIGEHNLVVAGALEGLNSLIVEFPPSDGPQWSLKARLMWHRALGNEDEFKFEFGVELSPSTPEDEARLNALIDSID